MCDASDYAVGVVLGQRIGKASHAIYYASRTLNDVYESARIYKEKRKVFHDKMISRKEFKVG